MKLTLWTYEGPPHVGAMRVATAMKDLQLVLHGPQGDTYADLLFTMIERRNARPPVSFSTFEASHMGTDTAILLKDALAAAHARYKPQAMAVALTCTAELLQDDPNGISRALNLPIPVVPLELPSYSRKENYGADETFRALVRALAVPMERTPEVTCNLLGATALGFRHRDDVAEVTKLLATMGVKVNVCAPLGASPDDLRKLGQAHFNVLMYPETGESAARHLERACKQPFTKVVPIGVGATRDFLAEVSQITGLPVVTDESTLRQPWWSASVDSTYLTGKRVFIFGDGTHVIAAARIAAKEIGFEVVGMGCYNREMARPLRTAAAEYGLEALVTDDYLEVEKAIEAAAPELILGTQMERNIAKKLGLPCAVISAPVHVQDFPARYAPQMGFEGANVLFDTWVHPLVMGLEEHLLTMFREDFEFHDAAGASHHGGKAVAREETPVVPAETAPAATSDTPAAPSPVVDAQARGEIRWLPEAERELRKIPFFVRGKAKRNTELYAAHKGVCDISVETLYEAKAHYAR